MIEGYIARTTSKSRARAGRADVKQANVQGVVGGDGRRIEESPAWRARGRRQNFCFFGSAKPAIHRLDPDEVVARARHAGRGADGGQRHAVARPVRLACRGVETQGRELSREGVPSIRLIPYSSRQDSHTGWPDRHGDPLSCRGSARWWPMPEAWQRFELSVHSAMKAGPRGSCKLAVDAAVLLRCSARNETTGVAQRNRVKLLRPQPRRWPTCYFKTTAGECRGAMTPAPVNRPGFRSRRRLWRSRRAAKDRAPAECVERARSTPDETAVEGARPAEASMR